VAANHAGEVLSPWTLIQTLESSPSGPSKFTVKQKENGWALLLQWVEPMSAEGLIEVTSTPRVESHLVSSR
jgi:usherin